MHWAVDRQHGTSGQCEPRSYRLVWGRRTRLHIAWACESPVSGALCKQPDYALDEFVAVHTVHERLAAWVAGDWKEQSLMLNGAGGLGKTDGGIYVAKFVSYTQVYETLL